MRTQKTFQFYSSSVLIVYDARKLRQTLEAKKRSSSGSVSPNIGNGSPGASTGDLFPPTLTKTSVSLSGSGEAINTVGNASPKPIYKKLQRSHSSTNNYEQVKPTRVT